MSACVLPSCQSDLIAAYLDGELDEHQCNWLETHLIECATCRTDLAEQRRLLCALDCAFVDGSDLPLPRNFAKAVAVQAENDLSGVRQRKEHKRALVFCLALAISALGFLGLAARDLAFGLLRTVVYQASEIVGLVWSVLSDAVSGLVIISRVVSRGLIPGSFFAGLLTFLLVALALLLLSRLITNYHRTRPIE